MAHLWPSVALTASRVVSAIVVNKLVAVNLGPAGLALVGQFQSFTAVALGVTSGNITNAVIGTVAHAQRDGQARAISTSIAATALGTLFVAVLVWVFAVPLARFVLGNDELAPVMHVLALLMVPTVIHIVLLAVLAGLGKSLAFTGLNAAMALVSAPACWGLITAFGIDGALICAVAVNAGTLVITGVWAWRYRPFPLRWAYGGIYRDCLARLVRLAGMTLSTLLIVPIAQLLLRDYVIEIEGVDGAGQWQAAFKIGEVLVILAATVVSLHYLPKFSAPMGTSLKGVYTAAGSVLLLLVVLGGGAFVSRSWVLSLLFSGEFTHAASLLPAQMLGDALRGGAWVMQAAMLARLRARAYVTVDVVYSVALVAAGYVLVARYEAVGAAMAALVAGGVAFLAALVFTSRGHPAHESSAE